MNIEHMHNNWVSTQLYRRQRKAERLPIIASLEQMSDLFALLEQVLATQGTSLDEYLLTLGPKPAYLK